MTIFTAWKRRVIFFFLWLPAESLSSVQSEMFCLQPEWQTPFNHIKSGLFTCQAEHTHWQHNFSPSASHCSLLLNSTHHYDLKGTEMEKEKKENFHESPVSYTSSSQLSSPTPALSLTSVETPAAFCWRFSSNYLVGSTLTQLRLHSSSSSSSAPTSSVKARLPLWHQLLLISRMGLSFQLCSNFFLWHRLNLRSISSVALRPDWRQRRLRSDMAMTPLWPWLHFDSKPAVHQLWLMLSLKPQTQVCPMQKALPAQW